jgi:hypothetical protein
MGFGYALKFSMEVELVYSVLHGIYNELIGFIVIE